MGEEILYLRLGEEILHLRLGVDIATEVVGNLLEIIVSYLNRCRKFAS